MHVISKSDFDNWLSDPVTKAYYAAVQERIADATSFLVVQAGIDSKEDNFYRGFIRAYQEALQFRIDDLEETTE